MLYTDTIASHLTRHSSVGKTRRPEGDPVAELKEFTRHIEVPRQAPNHLSVPFSIFDPKASKNAEDAGRILFHCVGDTGGIHGTATEEAIAEAMEEQTKTANAREKPAFFYNLGDVVYFVGDHLKTYKF